MLPVRSILSDLDSYNINDILNDSEYLEIDLAPKRRTASCPKCGKASRSVHSRYVRTLAHVPVALKKVRIRLLTRRFRCRNPSCAQRVFAERADGLGRAYARTTESNRACLQRIGSSAGANPGQRLARGIGLATSATTLRRRILEIPIPEQQAIRVLGVDDWAWCKGRRYGTLLCDLETGQIVDLLPERSAASLAEWLKAHPSVEIISRDRASCYADGSRQGAPKAIQVADRWHLLKNMTDALERLLYRHHRELKRASVAPPLNVNDRCQTAVDPSESLTGETGQTTELQLDPNDKKRPPSCADRDRSRRRSARRERYTQVVKLQQDGLSLRAIARKTGLSRATIRKYIASGAFPEISAFKTRGSQLDLYEQMIRERLMTNEVSVKELLQELRRLGYSGSESALRRYIRRRLEWRKRAVPPNVNATKPRCPSPRAVGLMIMQTENKRSEQDTEFLNRLIHSCSQIGASSRIASDFADMIRQRQPERFEDWQNSVSEAAIPELVTFANVLDRDRDAVVAALTLPWSNGPTEGHINRLKSIKRQMYGRAGFQMLRQRLLIPT